MAKVQAPVPVIEWYSAKSAARLSGLSLDMVNYLGRHEIVVASGNEQRGRGQARKYTYSDVLLLRVMGQLLAQGVSVLGLRKSLTAYRKRGSEPDIASCRYFVTDGYNVFLQNDGRLEDLTSGQRVFAFVLEMNSIRDSLRKKMGRVRSVANG